MDPSAFGDAGGDAAAGCGGTGDRPKIAVVLSGGGAKGSAHIGILKVLEQKRIPVDIIVGTSMGSYVAGMYAMGLSAEEVERTTLAIDWNKGYQDKVGRDELSLRKKQQNETVSAAHRHRGEWRHHPAAGRFLPVANPWPACCGGHLQPAGAGELR